MAQVLFKCARVLNEQSLALVRARLGAPNLRPAHTTLFPHVDIREGTRLTELARRVGISKQAVGQLVGELVEMGMLERLPDPDDRRARRIRFTGGGEGLLQGLAVLGEAEGELRRRVGDDRIDALRETLLLLLDELEQRPLAAGDP